MPLETGTYISDLDPSNPVGYLDQASTADDHLRLLKQVLINTFPSLWEPMTLEASELNAIPSQLSAIPSQIAAAFIVGETRDIRGGTTPAKWLDENGQVVAVATYSALATAIYCGDANNATADWGYKCTNPASPTTSRSTSGTHIVLPDSRGRYKQMYPGTGSYWSNVAGSNAAHSHTLTDPGHVHLQRANGADQEWGTTSISAGLAGGAISSSTTVNSINTNSATTGITMASSGSGSAPVPNSTFVRSIIYAGV